MPARGLLMKTQGERLYQYLAENLLGDDCQTELSETQALKFGGRTHELSQYFFGFACANIFARLVKKAERVLEFDRSAPDKVLAQYIERSLEVAFGNNRETVRRIAALSIDASRVSGRSIPPSVYKAVIGQSNRHHCYLCGNHIRKDGVAPGERLELEHLWPSSYGGDSVDENLIPSCDVCNREKGDMILWYTAHVAGFCLRPSPSEDEKTRVGRKQKIAWYMKRVYERAVRERLTLKDAALALGPIDMSSQASIDRDDARDFFNLDIPGVEL
jgi:5-methylcytosine-specific restriction endonuclease McrA